jgi:putative ABC transport system permease protein
VIGRAIGNFVRRARLWFATLGTSLRGMSANRLRAFLSTLGIAIGVATLMAIYAMVSGLRSSFAHQFGSLGANTLYVNSRPWVQRGDWWKYRNRPKITMDDVDALRRHADKLTAIAPAAFTLADVGAGGDEAEGVFVRGTTADFIDTSNMRLDLGRFLSPLDSDLDRPVVVIGSELRDKFYRNRDPIGDRITVGARYYTIIGVLAPQGKSFGQSLDNVAIIPLGSFFREFGERRDLAVAVTAKPEDLSAAEDQIVEVLRRERRLLPDQDDTFSINRQSELLRIFNQQMAAIFGVALAVGLITLIVGGVGVMNIMLVAVTERTREIGVRRALGARRRTILVQFLVEASLVTMMGGALGTAAGLGGAWLLAKVSPLSAEASPQAALIGLAFSAFVGLLFGTWPAWRAASLDPIESLRYE